MHARPPCILNRWRENQHLSAVRTTLSKMSLRSIGRRETPYQKSDGIVRIMRDKKHRGGKTVTVITGIPANSEAITTLAQQLKKLCGSGGTVKDGSIEIQGDHLDKIQTKLTELGYKVKRSGG